MKFLFASILASIVVVEANIVVNTVSSSFPATSNAAYTCTFYNQWSGVNHPIEYPGNAHWSPPVIAAHGAGYAMWEAGEIASAAVKLVAETGSPAELSVELSGESLVEGFVTGVPTFNSMTQTQTFDPLVVTPMARYMSSISMIAPSPDWFSGFSKFDTVDGDGNWFQEFTIATGPWDAGTEDGDTYNTENDATSPQSTIMEFTTATAPSNGVFLNAAQDAVLPVVSWTCRLGPAEPLPAFDVTTTDSSVASTETVNYECQFINNWSAVNHPIMYPSSAHWSPPILAAHTNQYTMWEESGMSSDGVQLVAETGGTSTLQDELSSAVISGTVGTVVVGTSTFNSVTQVQFFDDIEMTPTFHYMSTISMIAPSPDWFTGYYGVDFINSATETWYDEVVITTYAWDAGTEEGDTYSGANDATVPAEPILRFGPMTVPSNGVLLNSDGDAVLPMATWECTLQDSSTGIPGCPPDGLAPIRRVICLVVSVVSRILFQ
eukprot:CAMPEP_0118685436 /NCGR_PEP_ID=MMETSP0800-20121206/7242_1 /TAXON_ID=210618 ORGANISM="Striatella unipunctata, Strain CCMP2910" /NCGR_SAMPLE_ID=MMETSP0800 /ASSEMBLY_ACC=CAM_ASM_000638 /LENGTH=491 /DNA_ID=CAMNT_0006582341 /DNA_START=108 /DNA_END=1583 /DNA_ORIENTATION=+